MKILLLKDKKIRSQDLSIVIREVSDIYKQAANIDLTFYTEDWDYTEYPTSVYPGYGDVTGIDYAYLRKHTSDVYSRWSESVDHVVFLIHRDNWTLKRVWGWNISTYFSGYSVAQVRFDHKNLANSVGTLYHELMHDHDAMVYTYTGEVLEDFVTNTSDWDRDVVHGGRDYGGHATWEYIRYKENQAALTMAAPHIRKAAEKRHAVYTKKKLAKMQEIIRLGNMAVVLLRQLIAQKRGDIPLLVGNKCNHG